MSALRTFREHQIRSVESLAGWWEFVTEPERPDRDEMPCAFSRTIAVPSAWETLPGYETYRGRAWLRTHFETMDSRAVRLAFGGVSHTAAVYIDGVRVGSHYDAFTPWSVVASGLRPGRHELVVAVDNSFGDHSALHTENDYYSYGGITRPVELQFVPETFLERLFLVPVQTPDGWALDVRVRVKNLGKEACIRRVTLRLMGREFDLGAVTLEGATTVETRTVLRDICVEPWTAETPTLYRVKVVLSDEEGPVDDLADRVGFRTVRVEGKEILLNGESVRLVGYNRHEDHPQFGNALPLEAMIQDLQIIRDLGCNFVRTSHYPNDRRFLDLCDEMGVYVWEESHARQVDFDHPAFVDQITTSTVEMVESHYNHACIVMWGCLNECDSHTVAGAQEHQRVLRLIKELDASRPVTFASHHFKDDLCFGFVDIVAMNLYTGWYRGSLDDVERVLEDLLEWLHSPESRGGQNKPVIISEFGAGAVYGNRQRHRAKWSEEFQADYLRRCLQVYLNHPDVAGVAIWQFCDIRVTPGWDKWQMRPRMMNNKGTVDEYRRPKLCYDTVKQQVREARGRCS